MPALVRPLPRPLTMSWARQRGICERVDPNDPALSVDGLTDFLPTQTASEIDSMLAIDAVEELFPEKEARDVEDYFTTASGESLTPLSALPAFQSEIQRAAMEFERFAEEFHSFASECQHRRPL